jgi:hypothetical protein
MPSLRILAPLLLLPACVPIPVPVPEGTPFAFEVVINEGDSCGARDLDRFVGQPAGAVERVTLAGPDGTPVTVRVIRPGDAVTEDFNPARVNVRVGADGLVTAIDCG